MGTTICGRLVLAAGVLAGAAAGCRTSGIYVPAVQMQLSVQPTEVRAGDTVRIAVTVTNPRPDTVTLDFGPECRVSFMVLDHAGRSIHPDENSRCMAPGGGRLVLAPREVWRTQLAWPAGGGGGEPLPAGRYQVAAVLGDHDSTVRGKREYKMGSGAHRVDVHVVPAGP
jgi:hypothetical protein